MTKESAIKFLKLLHSIEQEHSKSLFGQEIRSTVQEIRFSFIRAYNGKNIKGKR